MGQAAPATPGQGEITRLAKAAAAIQMTLGSYLGLAAAILTAAAATTASGSQDVNAESLGQVRLWAIGIGLVTTIGGRLAWRGSPIGRISGILAGALFAFLAGAAIVDPLPGLPASLTIPVAVIVLGLMVFIVAVDLFAWRRAR